MAVTGLCFIGFLCIHLMGNLTLYGGAGAFSAYAQKLHSLGVLVTAAEWTLLLLALVHVVTGITLFIENLGARPVRYAVKRREGGRSLGSATMPYTGLVLLGFVSIHLVNFRFVDSDQSVIFERVAGIFHNPWYVGIYVAAMIVAAVHVSHGLWSAFQSLGIHHPKYMPLVRRLSLVFSLVVGIGFGCLPVYIAFIY
jgi:succinate dehydrogenase / fumarate reductase cytochrome b subunit